MFNQFNQKSYAKSGRYTDLQTYFLEKNIWRSSQMFQGIVVPKFQGSGYFLINLIGCGYCTEFTIETFQPFICYEKI